MNPKWICFFVLVTVGPNAFSQLHDRTSSHVRFNGLGFVNSSNHFKAVTGECGIYSSESDRQSGILSMAINCADEDHKIKAGFIREKSSVKIIRNEQTHSFLRSDIYGYRDCKGKEYHFFDGKTYELLNPGERIPIYRTFEQIGKQRVSKFAFLTASGDMKALTLNNLTDSFSDNPAFVEKLHLLAENNRQLVKYLYGINRIREDDNSNYE